MMIFFFISLTKAYILFVDKKLLIPSSNDLSKELSQHQLLPTIYKPKLNTEYQHIKNSRFFRT